MGDFEVDTLYENCETFTTITCSSCGDHDITFGLDSWEASNHFSGIGWRSTKFENVYCPKCGKKKLKPKK